MADRKRDTAIAELQAAFDRLPTTVTPALRIRAAYVFGSLARDVKKSVGDVDLIIVLENMADVQVFLKRLMAFLMEPDSLQAPVREAMFTRYHELHAQAWEVRKRLAWKWPPLSDFACTEPARTVLAATGVHPEWLSLFTWGEVCNWERYGMPNYQFLSPERLVRRALFGFKRDFELVRVASTLEEAMDRLVTEQVVLAWSPEKPDVARNLALDDAARRMLIEREYENMWRRLQTVNTKNAIIEDLCRHYLSQSLSEAHRQVKAVAEFPSRGFLMKWAARTGASEEDLTVFFRGLAFLNAADSTSPIPSLTLDRPPELLTDEMVEVLRERLREATLRFRVLIRVRDALSRLLQIDERPVDLAAYLADCVPLNVASKASTLMILRTLGISKKVNATGLRIAEATVDEFKRVPV